MTNIPLTMDPLTEIETKFLFSNNTKNELENGII